MNPSLFYIYDGRGQSDESLHQDISIPKRSSVGTGSGSTGPTGPPRQLGVLDTSIGNLKLHDQIRLDTPVMTLKDQFNTKTDILKFPVESSHSYSYAHLSPNSLALRLNVLKRSLEILKDRPGLMNAINKKRSDKNLQSLSKPPLIPFIESQRAVSSNDSKVLKPVPGNASSVALAALFRPQMKRSDSFPVDEIYSQKDSKSSTKVPKLVGDEIYSKDLQGIIQLLDNNNLNLSTLTDLALTQDDSVKHDVIENRLMDALSTPFVNTSVMTTTNSETGTLSPSLHASTVALSLLNNNNNEHSETLGSGYTTNHYRRSTSHTNSGAMTPVSGNSRPFHSISSGKHALPQSVFTIDYEAPWSVKAANDLACLMFGVLKNMIRSLTLMDLIAPQFREFVTDRLSRSLSGEFKIHSVKPDSDIVFAGEIVAISRPGDQGYAWTSLWAKHKGSMIIFMFDQIPCDAFDVKILKDLSDNGHDFNIVSKTIVAGNLLREEKLKEITKLSAVSESMNKFLDSLCESNPEDETMEVQDTLVYGQSEKLNIRRYFTLQLDDENIPCAVTSNPIDINPGKLEMKLKIHTLPYIAGIFVIDSHDFKIISCNNAIARNLFGRSSLDLTGKSINTLIENFHAIYKTGVNDMSNEAFSIVPGLVLPEHFFRKYDSQMRHKSNDPNPDFINARGLKAMHVDGHSLYVDVQLRVSALDTYVLWITYSRHGNNVSEDDYSSEIMSLDGAGTGNQLLRPQMKRARLTSKESLENEHGFTSLPSQLRLFDHDTTLPTVGEITRHNSTRNPKSSMSLKRITSDPERRVSAGSDSLMSDTPYSTLDSRMGLNQPSISDKSDDEEKSKISETTLLKQEDAVIKQKSETSKYWPQEIGDARRIKKIEEFDIIRELGEGAYGKVVLARHKEDKPYEIIIKCIDKERILVDTWVRDRKLGTIPSEIQIMSTLMKEVHPNIMRIIDFFEDEQYYYLETPIFGDPPAIDLFDYIEVKKDMAEQECHFIFKQVVQAIFHLHKHGIVHRDIKDENVIVDERGIIKLIDFGSAGYTKLGPFDVFVGTIDYASPEVLRGEKYEGKPQDIWALGILLYTILYKENPFYNVDEIMEGDLRLPLVISEGPIRLIQRILVRDIEKRPTITDILEDDWLN